MKKIICCLLIQSSIFLIIKSQDISINVDNKMPRQLQSIQVSIEFSFFDNCLRKQLGKSFDLSQGFAFPFTRIMTPHDTGIFQIGPFNFEINHIRYTSDSVKIKVLPALPNKEGVYISSYIENDKTILVIEQVYNSKSNNSDTENLVDIVIRDYNKFLTHKLGKNDNPLNFNKIVVNNNGYYLHYSIKRYEMTNYTGKDFQLTNEDFKNLPKDFVLPKIVVLK